MPAPDHFPLPPAAFLARPRRAAGSALAWLGFSAALLRAFPFRMAWLALPSALCLFLALASGLPPWRWAFAALAAFFLAAPLLGARRAAKEKPPAAESLGGLLDFGQAGNRCALLGALLWGGLFLLSAALLLLPFSGQRIDPPSLAAFAGCALLLLGLDWLLLCAFALFLQLSLCLGQPFAEALIAAPSAVAKNLPAFLALGAWLLIAAFLLLPATLGLGLLLWLPLFAGALHAACRDIFLAA
jgi:hypothetical protein